MERCPACGSSVEEGKVYCPSCGTRLRDACPHCGGATVPDGLFCPHCGLITGDPVQARSAWQHTRENLAVDNSILDKIPDFSVRDPDGATLLMHAILTEESEVVRRLLKAGADPNARDNEGATALHYAAREADTRATELLLAQPGIEVDARNNDGDTPILIAATEADEPEVVRLLLEADAYPDQMDADGEPLIHRVIESSQETGFKLEVLDLLDAYDADFSAEATDETPSIIPAIRQDDPQLVQRLIDGGVDPDIEEHLGGPVIVYAAQFSTPEVVIALVDGGADVNDDTGMFSITPLHGAAGRDEGSLEMCRLLMELGADPDATDDMGKRAEEYAEDSDTWSFLMSESS